MFDSDSKIHVVFDQTTSPSSHGEFGRRVSHGRTSAFYDHLDHRLIAFKNEKRCSLAGAVRVWTNMVCAVC